MKRLYVAVFAAVVGFAMLAEDAEARRLGGSRSFGMSRDTASVKQAAPTPAAPTAPAAQTAMPATKPAAAAPATPQPSGMSRWLGPIAGLAAGIGLAALLSHFGLGEGFASVLMILLLVAAAVFVVRLLLRRGQPQPAYAGAAAPARFEPVAPAAGAATPATTSAAVPADFDTEGFLRQAKLNFIRLQAANDAGNLEDLKQFTAPEVFAEIQMQFEERGRGKQETDVTRLDADLLELVSDSERHVASVRFSGEIREEVGGPAQNFAEIWHLTKPVRGGGWVVAGIQQIQ